jgi:hypothetical protein
MATHFIIEPDDTELFCVKQNEWATLHFDSSDTGPAENICDGCGALLIDNDKPATPHHIHLGEQWFCRGQQGLVLPNPDYTHTVGSNFYSCSECRAAFILSEHGEYPNGS